MRPADFPAPLKKLSEHSRTNWSQRRKYVTKQQDEARIGGQTIFTLVPKFFLVLLSGEVPEIKGAYDVSRFEQDLPNTCDDRIIIAASQRGIWMSDYGGFCCIEQVGLRMLFWMVQATI